MRILNIAAGKFNPLITPDMNWLEPNYVLNIDTSYFDKTDPEEIEGDMQEWESDGSPLSKYAYLNIDVFEFMERCRMKFGAVSIYRFLEHVSFTQVEYFIYLVSTVIEKGGIVDVIVPNYRILAEMIINEENYYNVQDFDFHPWNILLTTELLNEPSCPHASIWTVERMKKFWELEGRFKVKTQQPAFKFDGRDIYLRSLIERI